MATVKRTHRVGSDAPRKPVRNVEVLEDDTDGVEEIEEAVVSQNGSGGRKLIDQLREYVSQKAQRPSITLTVPLRPRISVRFNPTIDFDDYQDWLQKCQPRKRDATVNLAKLAAIVLSRTCEAILIDGVPVPDDEGGGYMTFTSQELHKMVGAPLGGTAAAIKEFYGSDGHMIQAMNKIVTKAGFSIDGDVMEDDDESPLDD